MLTANTVLYIPSEVLVVDYKTYQREAVLSHSIWVIEILFFFWLVFQVVNNYSKLHMKCGSLIKSTFSLPVLVGNKVCSLFLDLFLGLHLAQDSIPQVKDWDSGFYISS